MKIYNITIGQLITLWLFGLLGSSWLFMSGGDIGTENNFYYIIAIIFVLIFYSIGWRNWRNKK